LQFIIISHANASLIGFNATVEINIASDGYPLAIGDILDFSFGFDTSVIGNYVCAKLDIKRLTIEEENKMGLPAARVKGMLALIKFQQYLLIYMSSVLL